MTAIYHPLLALLASATDRSLAKYVQFLKEENKILRARIPGQVYTKPAEREKLLKFGKPIGRGIEELITIVSPKTFYRWVREEGQQKKCKNAKGGQRKPREVRQLVIEIARTTGFGYTRILGELRKLGIRRISRQTVRNILKEEGIQPGPERTSDSWTEFLERHKETLWGADFFSVRTVTKRGFRQMYALVFLCLTTREVIVSESTGHPTSQWVCDQLDRCLDQTNHREKKPEVLMFDRDAKFTKEFRAKLKSRGVVGNRLPKQAPNLNGRCERFILTLKYECLQRFVIFGKQHLDYLLSEFVAYYNEKRSHSGCGNLPPQSAVPDEVATLRMEQIEVKSYLGGLLKSFERKAA